MHSKNAKGNTGGMGATTKSGGPNPTKNASAVKRGKKKKQWFGSKSPGPESSAKNSGEIDRNEHQDDGKRTSLVIAYSGKEIRH